MSNIQSYKKFTIKYKNITKIEFQRNIIFFVNSKQKYFNIKYVGAIYSTPCI